MLNAMALENPGVYTLIIYAPKLVKIRVGKLGLVDFPAGYYAYTGSALGRGALSLRGRVERHFRAGKKLHWHIDFLLNSRTTKIVSAVVSETKLPKECQVSSFLEKTRGATVIIKGFGSQDCKLGCGAHLHHFPTQSSSEVIKLVLTTHRKVGLSPVTLSQPYTRTPKNLPRA